MQRSDQDQINLGIGYRIDGAATSTELVKIDFLINCLASNWTAKLIDELRVKNNLVYWVNGEFSCYSDLGYLGFTFSVTPDRLAMAAKKFLMVIDKIKQGKISPAEMNAFKNSYAANTLRRLMAPDELMWWYGLQAVYGRKILTPETHLNLMKKITRADLQKIANDFIVNKNISINAIGPSNEEKIRQAFRKVIT